MRWLTVFAAMSFVLTSSCGPAQCGGVLAEYYSHDYQTTISPDGGSPTTVRFKQNEPFGPATITWERDGHVYVARYQPH